MIRLRTIDTEHLPYVQEFASDPEVSKASNVPYPYPVEGAWSWYAGVVERTKRKESQVFAILDAEFVGVCSLNSIAMQSGTCEIDYWVAKHAWGRGVCTAAVNQALLYCKHVLGIRAVFSACLARNPASERVLLKTGFTRLGKFSNQGQFGDRHLETMVRYRKILREDGHDVSDPKGIVVGPALS